MTAQLDPWELEAPDEHVLSKDCWCGPEVFEVPPAIPAEGIDALPILNLDEFELGAACNLGDTECEACQ